MENEEKSALVFDSFSRKLSILKLTNVSFRNEDIHITKILSILAVLLQNGPASKWELATVTYRDSVKNGLTSFSWVLVHKLILEMIKLGLIEKRGKSNLNDGKSKKHVVDLYYPTYKGILFTLCAEEKLYKLNKNKELDSFRYIVKNEEDEEIVFSLLNVIWRTQHINAEAGREIRILTMDRIVLNTKPENSFTMILNTIISYMLDILSERTMEGLVNLKGKGKNGALKMAALKSALTGIKHDKVREIVAMSLIQKIGSLSFSLRMANWIFDDLKIQDIDIKKAKFSQESALEQIFLRMITVADFGESMNAIEPAMNTMKALKKTLRSGMTSKKIQRMEKTKSFGESGKVKLTDKERKHAEKKFSEFLDSNN